MRLTIALLAFVTALTLFAGGSTEARAASKPMTIRTADAICAQANRDAGPFGTKADKAIRQNNFGLAAGYLEQGARIELRAVNRVKRLPAAAPGADRMREWVRAETRQLRYIVKFADRLRSGSLFDELAGTYADQAEAWGATADDQAAAYGFRVCGTTRTKPGPALKPTSLDADPWPEDKKGWTVILLSTTSKDEATALALKARDKGVPAGILQSDTYKNLSSGLWMVWAGRFGSENEAYSAATTYSGKGFDGESVEYVRKKAADDSGDGSDNGSDGTSTTPTTPTTDGG